MSKKVDAIVIKRTQEPPIWLEAKDLTVVVIFVSNERGRRRSIALEDSILDKYIINSTEEIEADKFELSV